LRAPPFTGASLPRTGVNNKGNTRRPVPTIANLLRRSVKRYEATLEFDPANLSVEEKRACFPAPPNVCAKAPVRADLDLRDLLRNDALEAVQEPKSDLSFWLEEGDRTAEDDEVASTDAVAALAAARAALARYVESVPAAEVDSASRGAAALASDCSSATDEARRRRSARFR
jgi:hypothetical protein